MESEQAIEPGKAEALRWLRRRLQTEALLEALHARNPEGVTPLHARRKQAPASAPSMASAPVSVRGAC